MYQRGMNSANEDRNSLFAGSSIAQRNSNSALHAEQTRNLIEEQNNQQINHLSLQINSLKQLTTDIHGEVLSQNKYLDGMNKDFENTDSLLGNTLKKVGNMLEQGGSKHMCFLIAFVVLIFILLYFVFKGY